MSVGTGTAGPQPRAPDLSGHCRTPTLAESASSQWALPDPNRERSAGPQLREPDLSGHCRTSIANARCHIECQPEFQIECQKKCLIECLMKCQIYIYISDKNAKQNAGWNVRICMPNDVRICQIECQIYCQNTCQIEYQLVEVTRIK